MDLRAARETDIPGIRDVASRSLAASYDDVLDDTTRQQAVETWYSTDDSSPGRFTEELSDDRSVVVVAEEDDEILGFVQAFVSGSTSRVGQIEWLHVRPERRGEGIGERLLEEVETELAAAGVDRIESRVIEENEAGREFYEYHGYEPDHTQEVALADDVVEEVTLVAEPEAAEAESTGTDEPEVSATERRETPEGEELVVAYDESERGTDGPFHPTYLDEEREEQYGWYCAACGSLDVNVGSMDEFVCDECGNRRRAMRWDAVYGG